MTTKITVIYDNLQDLEAFEAGYPDQLALAKKLPGFHKPETSKVWPKEDGNPTPTYHLVDLYFTDYNAASEAATTEEAGAFFPSDFALAASGVRIIFAHVEASCGASPVQPVGCCRNLLPRPWGHRVLG